MDIINQLTTPEKLISGGALLMLIASFFPWYRYSLNIPAEARAFTGISGSVSEGAWGAPGEFWSILAVLLSLALAGAVLAPKLGNVRLPDLGTVTWGQAFGGGAAVLVVLMLLKAWRIMAVPVGGFGFGFLLGIVAAAAVAAGAYLIYTEQGGSGGGTRPA